MCVLSVQGKKVGGRDAGKEKGRWNTRQSLAISHSKLVTLLC